MFYFAWVDKTDTTFSETEHTREDEQIFGFTVTHAEGDFAALDIELVNPGIGLLAPARKQWAWLSYRNQSNDIIPLFFGRLIGVPEEMAGNVVRLSFIARPADYEEQKEALAETLRVAPWYDPAWLSPEERQDPDRVLEGYTRYWHVDRVTGEVTTSDIINGEDGTYTFEGDEVFYDSLSVTYSESPARSVIVEASVNWAQRGSGSIDLTPKVIEKFQQGNVNGTYSIGNTPVNSEGTVNVVAGDDMIENWPKEGTSFGGNWTVGYSYARLVGPPPTDPIMVGGYTAMSVVGQWGLESEPQTRNVLRTLFDRSPGIIVQVIDHNDYSAISQQYTIGRDKVEFLWIPIWRIAPRLEVNWGAERQRSETVQFTLNADVQPLLTDPGESEIVRLSIGPADVDEFIGDARRPRYFNTSNGHTSLENLIARARAILLNRARAIDVSFEVPFDTAIGLSCRMSGYVAEPRIPGGYAAGKVKEYAFSAEGDTGELVGSVTLACAVGRDGTVTAEAGDPNYCVADYVGSDYQEYDNVVTLPLGSDVGYTLSASYPMDDDGVNLFSVLRDEYLIGLELDGTLDTHEEKINKFPRVNPYEVIDRADAFTSTFTVRMRPIRNLAFSTTVEPDVTELKVPRTIDLEETT